MQLLAATMGGELSKIDFATGANIADKYLDVKNKIIYASIPGLNIITHPHYTESYYVLSKHLKGDDF